MRAWSRGHGRARSGFEFGLVAYCLGLSLFGASSEMVGKSSEMLGTWSVAVTAKLVEPFTIYMYEH